MVKTTRVAIISDISPMNRTNTTASLCLLSSAVIPDNWHGGFLSPGALAENCTPLCFLLSGDQRCSMGLYKEYLAACI